jgi:hypothetical protein
LRAAWRSAQAIPCSWSGAEQRSRSFATINTCVTLWRARSSYYRPRGWKTKRGNRASSIHQLKDLRHRTMSTMPPSWEVIGRRTKECADSDKSMVTIREKHQQVVPEVLLKAFTLHRRLLTNWRKATSQTPMDLSYRRFSPNVAHDSWRISLRANDKASRYHLKRFGAAVGLKSGRTRVQSSRIVAVIRKHNLSSPQAVPGTRFGAR